MLRPYKFRSPPLVLTPCPCLMVLTPCPVLQASPPVPLSTTVERGDDGRTEFPRGPLTRLPRRADIATASRNSRCPAPPYREISDRPPVERSMPVTAVLSKKFYEKFGESRSFARARAARILRSAIVRKQVLRSRACRALAQDDNAARGLGDEGGRVVSLFSIPKASELVILSPQARRTRFPADAKELRSRALRSSPPVP